MHKSQIHPSVLKLPKSATFNADDVLSWLKTNKEKLPELRRLAHRTPRIEGAMAELKSLVGSEMCIRDRVIGLVITLELTKKGEQNGKE